MLRKAPATCDPVPHGPSSSRALGADQAIPTRPRRLGGLGLAVEADDEESD
jgi:hypothetical protein